MEEEEEEEEGKEEEGRKKRGKQKIQRWAYSAHARRLHNQTRCSGERDATHRPPLWIISKRRTEKEESYLDFDKFLKNKIA
ncbi:hypothetical protein E2C01_065418 [Portunus trituberculatus]|uniref:Uncharacterized protein n=1 Tax=Portunus trituberculatus TaxID=210409 RepID=A0A5B7HR21_PORTR|nr:hypothetical protein [Portunus trituberculatus]